MYIDIAGKNHLDISQSTKTYIEDKILGRMHGILSESAICRTFITKERKSFKVDVMVWDKRIKNVIVSVSAFNPYVAINYAIRKIEKKLKAKCDHINRKKKENNKYRYILNK